MPTSSPIQNKEMQSNESEKIEIENEFADEKFRSGE
jgi:hypothetical protein